MGLGHLGFMLPGTWYHMCKSNQFYPNPTWVIVLSLANVDVTSMHIPYGRSWWILRLLKWKTSSMSFLKPFPMLSTCIASMLNNLRWIIARKSMRLNCELWNDCHIHDVRDPLTYLREQWLEEDVFPKVAKGGAFAREALTHAPNNIDTSLVCSWFAL